MENLYAQIDAILSALKQCYIERKKNNIGKLSRLQISYPFNNVLEQKTDAARRK